MIDQASMIMPHNSASQYRMAGNFQGRKTFANFAVFVAVCKSFLHEIWGVWHPLAQHKQAIHESFLLRKFPGIRYIKQHCYTTHPSKLHNVTTHRNHSVPSCGKVNQLSKKDICSPTHWREANQRTSNMSRTCIVHYPRLIGLVHYNLKRGRAQT